MFCFGCHEKGALGLGGIENETIFQPTELEFSQVDTVEQVACGESHTAFVLSSGETFTFGSNEWGQLGHQGLSRKPQKVEELSNYEIKQIGCGCSHTVALNSWGQLYSWGSNSYGQLGHGIDRVQKAVQPIPSMIKHLATLQVIQVCCGKDHNLALTVNGDLYSWGNNAYGQLGLGVENSHASQPKLLESLKGLPIAHIAAGGNHSFLLTRSSALYGWGSNKYGQLGLNDEDNRLYPTQLRPLRSQKISYIACGENHTCALTHEGGVYTFGAGMFGQLGHNSKNNESTPRRVMELMGSVVTQISCGRNHTLAYIPDRGRLYGFGLGKSGQLGLRSSRNAYVPTVVHGAWERIFDEEEMKTDRELLMRAVFCGGDQSFALALPQSLNLPPLDYRERPANTQIPVLEVDFMKEVASISSSSPVPPAIMSNLEIILSSLSCLNASFLMQNNDHIPCSSKNAGISIVALVDGWHYLSNATNTAILELAFEYIVNHVIPELTSAPPDVEALRIFLVLPFYHEFSQPTNYKSLLLPFGQKILKLTREATRVLENWWISLLPDVMLRIVIIYKRVITHILNLLPPSEEFSEPGSRSPVAEQLEIALEVLRLVNMVNMKHGQKIPYDKFYISEITDRINIQLDYIHWHYDPKKEGKFYFCNYPFAFDANAKTTLLQTDARLQMHMAMNEVTHPLSFLMSPHQSQFLVLVISRNNLISDTISQLSKQPASDLKKPLKVIFHGEEAIDAGGVTKEFFLLLLKAILNPQYGMFKNYPETNSMWFARYAFEENIMFYLIGILCGLAIYNFTIIDLPFPLPLYKKLLGKPIGLSDYATLSPITAKNLQSLLDYPNDDIEDVFCLNFEITEEVFGEVVQEELKPGSKDVPVTKQNRQEYVDLYVDYVLNKSVEEPYKAFSNGFLRVCGNNLLNLFHPEELMALVVGNENYDWEQLEKNCVYANGCQREDLPIRMFWQVFHKLDEQDKIKFLMFLSGTNRIPIQGMKAINMKIQLTGAPLDHLPVAHTCFNLLDLPRYDDKTVLREKLLKAIQQSEGFALV